jgi:predicted anti-sigma-YlaC factor YlaD
MASHGCDEFEVHIEKRLHGALGETEQERLEAHLVGCEACQAYLGAARGAEAGMRARAAPR